MAVQHTNGMWEAISHAIALTEEESRSGLVNLTR